MAGGQLLNVCVVVPTYNERGNIAPLVEAVGSVGIGGLQLLFVDDSSPDGTADEIRRVASRREWVHLLVRKEKSGIGSAYIDGFREAMDSLRPEFVLEMDGDMQHPPSKIPELLDAVSGSADAAVASRYIRGGGVSGWSLRRRAVSRGANWYAGKVLGLGVKDCTSGFRAFTKEAVKVLLESSLPTSGFAFQVAALYRLRQKGMKVVEVPFVFEERRSGKSKLSLGEGIDFLFSIPRLRLGF